MEFHSQNLNRKTDFDGISYIEFGIPTAFETQVFRTNRFTCSVDDTVTGQKVLTKHCKY
jgi:hypothetical protein